MSTPAMHAWSWDGTKFRPCQTVPIADRGFRYGMALFESLRIWRGRPLFLKEHLAILRAACGQCEFPVPEPVWQAIAPLFTGEGRDGFARIYVTGGDGGAGAPAEECRVLALLEERSQHEREAGRVMLSPEAHQPLFGGLKTANYWRNIDAFQRAGRRGFDEALLFNEHAELVSAAMATVFVVRGGVIRTPSTACGARAGVLRGWILQREPVRECSLFLQDIAAADELFLANSWIGVLPVAEVEGRPLAGRTVAARLAEAYRREVLG